MDVRGETRNVWNEQPFRRPSCPYLISLLHWPGSAGYGVVGLSAQDSALGAEPLNSGLYEHLSPSARGTASSAYIPSHAR